MRTRHLLPLILAVLFVSNVRSQVGIGTTTPDSTAALDVSSNSKGLLIPRLTAAQKGSIKSPADGLFVYQSDGEVGLYVYANGSWNPIATFTTNNANGTKTLRSITSGTGNTAMGNLALASNTTGTNNTAIGNGADVSTPTLTNATAIGYNAKVGTSNAVVLGGTGTSAVKVGIGLTTPVYNLDVTGGTNLNGTFRLQKLANNYRGVLTAGSDGTVSVRSTPDGITLNYIICMNGYYPLQEDGSYSTSVSGPYIGEVKMFAGNYAPAGWALCNGQVLSIYKYQMLFAILGTQYGGDGVSTFALPDLRGRAAVHVSSTLPFPGIILQ